MKKVLLSFLLAFTVIVTSSATVKPKPFTPVVTDLNITATTEQGYTFLWAVMDISEPVGNTTYNFGIQVYMYYYGHHSGRNPLGWYGWGWDWKQFDYTINAGTPDTMFDWNIWTLQSGEQFSNPLQYQLVYFRPQ